MYRIEVAPGEETVFRTLEELAVSIRNGLVTPRARIYHNASQKWLPIGLHPHYKKALELPAASIAHPKTPTPIPAKAPGKPRLELHTAEHAVGSGTASVPRAPAPVVSPVVAMQQEVLRDLPVVMIPEPLPWARRPAPVETSAPPPAPALAPTPVFEAEVEPVAPAVPGQSQPTAIVTYAPSPQPDPVLPESVEPEPVQPEPVSPWPQFEPIEETQPRPTARRSNRARGRPLLLIAIATALVFAGRFVLRSAPSALADSFGRPEAEEIVSEQPEPDAVPEAPAPRVASPPAPAATSPRVTSSPARVPMTPGPAFAGSVPLQPGADTAAHRTANAGPAVSSPATSDTPVPSLAPAPVQLDLALPDIKADSIATAGRGDTLGMKKILRALNGSKP